MPRRKTNRNKKRKIQKGGSISLQNESTLLDNNQQQKPLLSKQKYGGRERTTKEIKRGLKKLTSLTASLSFEDILLWCTFITGIIMAVISIIIPNNNPGKNDIPTILISYGILLLCAILASGIYARKIMKNAGENAIYTLFKIALPALSAISSLTYIIFLNARWKNELSQIINYIPELKAFNIIVIIVSIIQIGRLLSYFKKKSEIKGYFNIGTFNATAFALLFLTSFSLTTVLFSKLQAYITDG